MTVALALLLATAAPETQLAALERDARRQEQRLAAARAPLTRLLARVERLALAPPVAALADTRSTDDLVRSRALLQTLRPAIVRQTTALRHQMIATQAARARLGQLIATRADRRARFGNAGQTARNRRLAALPVAAPATPPAEGVPVYLLPARGRVVIGTGDRLDGTAPARGLTLATPAQARVRSPAAGRVAYAGPFGGYGDIVVIDHGGGWATLLAGLSLATVSAGERVGQGATLGRMAAAEPRLAIELRHHGRPVDVAGMAAQRRPPLHSPSVPAT